MTVSVCLCMYTQTCACACTCICVYVYTYPQRVRVRVNVCMYTHTYTHTCAHVCIYVHIYARVLVRVYVCVTNFSPPPRKPEAPCLGVGGGLGDLWRFSKCHTCISREAVSAARSWKRLFLIIVTKLNPCSFWKRRDFCYLPPFSLFR